jgi:hypothetical protein
MGLSKSTSLYTEYEERYIPKSDTQGPRNRHQGEALRHVGGVSEFAHHALHHSNVAIQGASDATTIIIQKVKFTAKIVPHLRISPDSVLDNPKQSIDRESPNIPNKRTGLRPIRSDVRLHCKMVSAWVAKKSDSYHAFGKVVTRRRYDRRNLQSAPHNTLDDQMNPSIVYFNFEKYPSRSSRFHMESLQSYGAK